MNKTIKDTLIRFWRMKGYNVRDQPGFDMHGLPIEVQVEKKIGVRSKREIEEFGIDNFVTTCKNFAQELRGSMTEQFKRLGVWMDWEDPYQTLKLSYIEAAWWTLSKAYDKNLLVSDSRVLTWCPRCETALAEAEIEYWDEKDPSVMVEFPLTEGEGSLLIWTTTPWTLPSNMAVAAHPDFGYAKIRMKDGERSKTVIILESQAEHVASKGGFTETETLERMKGKDLEGLGYLPPFDIDDRYRRKTEWRHRVVLQTTLRRITRVGARRVSGG